MKKILLSLIATLVVLLVATTSVNAASLSAPSQVKEGDIVTVTVNVDETSELVQFVMTYDSSVFEYVEGSATGIGGSPTVGIPQLGTIKYVVTKVGNKTEGTVTLQFKALKTSAAVPFTISNFVSEPEQSAPSAASVSVVEKETGNPPAGGSETENPTGDTETETGSGEEEKEKESGKVGTNGKVITEIPQAGAPVIVGAIVLVVVAGAVVATKKFAK